MYVYVRACDYTTLSATRLEAYDLKIVPCHTMQKRGRQAQDSKSGASNCAYSHSSEATTTFPAACLARGHFDQMQTLARDKAKGCECKGKAEGGKGKGAAEGDIGTPPPPFLCLGDTAAGATAATGRWPLSHHTGSPRVPSRTSKQLHLYLRSTQSN